MAEARPAVAASAEPADPRVAIGSESAKMPSDVKPSLAARLNEAQKLADLRLRKMFEEVIRYNWYLEELRALKAASKKFQTPEMLKCGPFLTTMMSRTSPPAVLTPGAVLGPSSSE
jgi:hypothetical protein